jgi:hypothetical protein
VFGRPFPDVNGGKWQLSSGGGSAALWAHCGRELYYAANGKSHIVRINAGPPFTAETPCVLFTIPNRRRAGPLASGTFAITPDDQRFLMARDTATSFNSHDHLRVMFSVTALEAMLVRPGTHGARLLNEEVDDESVYRPCDNRGPEGIRIRLAARLCQTPGTMSESAMDERSTP